MANFEVNACRYCGRLFNSLIKSDVCPGCETVQEQAFYRVKDYLKAHKEARIPELCQQCDVIERDILRWVRQERLQFYKASGVTFPCLECGEPVYTGKYCEECKRKMIRNIRGSFNMPQETSIDEKRVTEMNFLKKRRNQR